MPKQKSFNKKISAHLMSDNYNILISKLDEFIRKFYKNLLIRGAIYAVAVVLVFYLLINLLEYYAHFGIVFRTLLFYFFICINTAIIIRLIIIPVFKLYRFGKIITHTEAADIIGKHFSNINDKLLNVLQLKDISDHNPASSSLIEASINQKISLLRPIPFIAAIDFSQNRKYLKFAIVPIVLLVLILFTAPGFITDPTTRLLKHNTYYEKMPPFQFNVLNKKMTSFQQEDFQLDVKLTGDEIPDNVYIDVNGIQYLLNKENTVLFHYTFKNLQKDIPFKLMADNYESQPYTLKVLPKPIILNFDISLQYPAYINKKNETLQNTGDLVIPCGTLVTWHFNTKDTKKITFKLNDKTSELSKTLNRFTLTKSFNSNQNYTIITSNEFLTNSDSLKYFINTIPDAYPVINVDEYIDTVYENQHYFKGMIKDDYGFSNFVFSYKHRLFSDSLGKNTDSKYTSKSIQLDRNITQQEFFFNFDIATLDINPGDEIEYYFEVWDNDGVNGSKSSRSQKMIYKAPTLKEIKENTQKSNKQIEQNIEQTIDDAKKLQKQIDEFDKKMIEKKNISWQEKKQLKDLLEQHKQMQNKLENIQKQNQEKTLKENQFNKPNEEMLKKQEELNKLFEQLMTPEMKEMINKLQEMLDKLDKTKINEMMEKMKLESKDIEKELDRNLEIFKQLAFEKQLNESIEKLKDLSKKQDELSKETEKSDKAENKDLIKKQEDLNKQFEELQKDIKDLQKKNDSLENPNKMENSEQQQEDIKQEMQNSKENLNNKKNKKASQSQKNASEKMKDLADKMEKEQQDNEDEQQEEDINKLRELLENLIKTSFNQEDLIGKLNTTKTSDPKYTNITKQQKNIKDDMQMIEDSLFALSKRQPQIQSIVNSEISDINLNITKSLEALNTKQTSLAASKQQYVMTSVNDLALLLAEALQSMQQQQQAKSQQKGGSCKKPGSCNKPGSGKPSMKSMRQLQEQLNKQLQDMKDGKKPNGKQGQGQTMSEQLARMAAMQEAIRQQLQQLQNELKKEGQYGNQGNLDKLKKDMEQTEKDLVNKIISNETIKRQQEILTRLLESEKAQLEREMDEKRESNEAININKSNPNNFLEYKRLKLKESELLKTIPISLKSFYKNKVNEYFYNFEN